jgi:hypothetical protein
MKVFLSLLPRRGRANDGQYKLLIIAIVIEADKSNPRSGYDASMAEVVQPISDAELTDLAYLMAHAQ